jgi:hypothetical protein
VISIQDLLVPVTAPQARANAVTALVAMGIRADLWRVGGSLSTMLTVVTAAYAQFTILFAQAIASGFLTTATGGWLTLLAFYVYGVTRPVATFATGLLTLTNTLGGVYNYAAGAATFLDSTSKQTYTNLDPIALGPLSTQTIRIQCTAAGTIGNAPPGEVDALVTTMLGVTCGNASAIAGSDALSDPGLVALCLAKLGATSVRGPRNAFAFAVSVALNAVNGAPVNINRQSVSRSSHTGTVTIVVAAPSGAPDPNDVAGVVTSIETGVPGLSPPFAGVRPDCVTVNVSGAVPVSYSPAITVWGAAGPGIVAGALEEQIAAAINDYIEDFPVGGVATDQGRGLWGSGIETAIGAAINVSFAAQVAAQITAAGSDPVALAAIVSQLQAMMVTPNGGLFSVEGATDLPMLAGQVAVDAASVSVRLVNVS